MLACQIAQESLFFPTLVACRLDSEMIQILRLAQKRELRWWNSLHTHMVLLLLSTPIPSEVSMLKHLYLHYLLRGRRPHHGSSPHLLRSRRQTMPGFYCVSQLKCLALIYVLLLVFLNFYIDTTSIYTILLVLSYFKKSRHYCKHAFKELDSL